MWCCLCPPLVFWKLNDNTGMRLNPFSVVSFMRFVIRDGSDQRQSLNRRKKSENE